MKNRKSKLLTLFSLILITGIALAACTTSEATPTVVVEQVDDDHEYEGAEAEHEDEGEEAEHTDEGEEEHEDEDEHADEHPPEEHEEGGHEVPHEAEEVPNPIEASDESIDIGAELYANSCALCHGETGEGDGPGASGLAVPPADLHEDHVQGLTDGALFYIISHSAPDSPMPAWEDVLTEDERWHLVNFLRTFTE
ncbi:MAG: c-type cytochrome [Candidatus Hermodarchaeia archaeon]|jgi:cytochrome c5